MESAPQLTNELIAQSDDAGDEESQGDAPHQKEYQLQFAGVGKCADDRADDGEDNQKQHGEHILFLLFQIGEEQNAGYSQP